MKIKLIPVSLIALLAALASPAQADDSWVSNVSISSIQVVEHGGFLINLTTPLPKSCPLSAATTIYFYPDKNGMTEQGVKHHYAMALLAFSSDKKISIMYDDASTNCFARYMLIQK